MNAASDAADAADAAGNSGGAAEGSSQPESAAASETPTVAAPAPGPGRHRPRPGPRPSPTGGGPTGDTRDTGGTEPADGSTRRWILAGGAAVIVAGGAGVGAALLWPEHAARRRPAPRRPPALLGAAIGVETALIVDLDATTGGSPQVRRVLAQLRADHAAHLAALRAVAERYELPRPPTAVRSGTARTVVQLLAAERRASEQAARRAAVCDGGLAGLLASIGACEATHAELLS